MSPRRVLVAMSGGVDSSVAAALLRDEGHAVTGVTMRLWGGASDTGCCSVSDVDDARRVAQQIGIDHHVFNFSDDFEHHVVEPYVDAHARGRTPNPCVECNRHLKFDRLLRRARALGFDAVATGHHARVVEHDGSFRVARGADARKDQSYVLHMLGQRELARVLLPVGRLHKHEVRVLADDLGLRTATKPDSQDVCFVTRSEGRRGFLGDRFTLRPASVVDPTGATVGRVDAVQLVTVGQRRGLGLSGTGDPRYVLDVDVEGERVVVGTASQRHRDRMEVEEVAWADGVRDGEVQVQTSAHGRPQRARLRLGSAHRATVVWSQPQPRVAPGQSVVFYEGDEVLGGGRAI